MQESSASPEHQPIIRRATLKLMPLLDLLYLIAYLDRQNIGFARVLLHDRRARAAIRGGRRGRRHIGGVRRAA